MSLIAQRPMSASATRQADREFYQRHPEFVRNGHRIPLSECDRRDGRYRAEWLRLYAQFGGRIVVSDEARCRPVPRGFQCADNKGLLAVCVTREQQPVPEVFVEVESYGHAVGSGYTMEDGCIAFELQPGSYRASVQAPQAAPVLADPATVAACEERVVSVPLRPAPANPQVQRLWHRKFSEFSASNTMRANPRNDSWNDFMDFFKRALRGGGSGSQRGFREAMSAGEEEAGARQSRATPENHRVNVVRILEAHTMELHGMAEIRTSTVTVDYEWGPPRDNIAVIHRVTLEMYNHTQVDRTRRRTLSRDEANEQPFLIPPDP